MEKKLQTSRSEQLAAESARRVFEHLGNYANQSAETASTMARQFDGDISVKEQSTVGAISSVDSAFNQRESARQTNFQNAITTFIHDPQLDEIGKKIMITEAHSRINSFRSNGEQTTASITGASLRSINKIRSTAKNLSNTVYTQANSIDNYATTNYLHSNFSQFVFNIGNKLANLEQSIDNRDAIFRGLCEQEIRLITDLIFNKNRQGDNLSESMLRSLKTIYVSQMDRIQRQKTQSNYGRQDRDQSGTTSGQGDDSYRSTANSNKGDRKSTSNSNDDEVLNKRINTLRGNDAKAPVAPYRILIKNVDHHRSQGKTDHEIYRLMMLHFHPDRSENQWAEQVSRLLTQQYDKSDKKFRRF